ncbi:hypothetical protein [Nevskia sp.]|uniref:DUF6940 family protein n=1 Tax=Nevskia sp. TaxID=1929292 RepID=UPI0025E271C8|nr:hypothetical protein [Nevskia sp.]
MINVLTEALPAAGGFRLRIVDAEGRAQGFDTVFSRWRAAEDDGLRRRCTEALRGLPIDACFWELPALTAATLAQPFECVCLAAPALAAVPGPADRDSFQRAFAIDDGTPFASFDNLGGDALLIVPRPRSAASDYRHLLRFLRQAPDADADALWQRIALELDKRIARQTVWLSTAGLGVNWLHIRLDRRPKYFQHRPYISGH